MRAERLDEAAHLVRDVLAWKPARADAWLQLAEVEARRLRLPAAEQALARARSLAPRNPDVGSLARALAKARVLWAEPVAGDVETALRDARIFIVLGTPGLARRALAPVLARHPAAPSLRQMHARTEAADGNFVGARELLLQAQRDLPQYADRFRESLLELETLESQRRSDAGNRARGRSPYPWR
jgi:tetratricopeptide (TPR) repeat protein